jgi:hypothetical protein
LCYTTGHIMINGAVIKLVSCLNIIPKIIDIETLTASFHPFQSILGRTEKVNGIGQITANPPTEIGDENIL